MTLHPLSPHILPALSATDQEALTDLYMRGTPQNTLRAYERDLFYFAEWRETMFGNVRFGAAL